jgi:hypothetical protein
MLLFGAIGIAAGTLLNRSLRTIPVFITCFYLVLFHYKTWLPFLR